MERNDDIRLPAANLTDHFLAHFERWHQFAIGNGQDDVFQHPKPLCGLMSFLNPTLDQPLSAHFMMTAASIG